MDLRGTPAHAPYTMSPCSMNNLTKDRTLIRNIWETPTNYYSTFYSTLLPALHNTPLQAHIETKFVNRNIYSLKPSSTLNSNSPLTSEEEKASRAKRRSIFSDLGADTTRGYPPTHKVPTLQSPTHELSATTQRAA